MQTKNVVKAVRARLGAAMGKGHTGTLAPKRSRRRPIVLALAAVLAAVPISAAVQTAGPSEAQAAVNDRYAWITAPAAMTAFNFWMNGNWPAAGPSNARFNTGHGYVNGGGIYGDRDQQLRNWLGVETGARRPYNFNFREYDGEARPTPNTNRGADRLVLNLEHGILFHTGNHYTDFTPLNFGNLPTPTFPNIVYCYQNPAGQPNDTRITLHNVRAHQVDYTVHGLAGSGMSVTYHRTVERWNSHDGRYYVDTNERNWDIGMSFPAYNSMLMHNDPTAICRAFTPNRYGTR